MNWIAIKQKKYFKDDRTVHALKSVGKYNKLPAYCRDISDHGYIVLERDKDSVITCQNCIQELMKLDNIRLDIEVINYKMRAKICTQR